jgi:hypothetical protein
MEDNKKKQHSSRLKVSFLILLAIAYLYPFLRVLWRVGDEGTLVYGAQRVMEGALPYRDFFEPMGPGSFYFLAFFFKLFGSTFLVARGVLLFTGVSSVVLIHWMTRRLYQGPDETLPAIYYLIVSLPLWPATNHHWDSNLFFLLGVAVFFLWQDHPRLFLLLLAGILAGITSCFMQHKGLLLFMSQFLLILIENWRQADPKKGRLIVDLGLLTAGYAGVGVIVVGLFFLAGGLPDLIFANLIFPLVHYQKVNICPFGFGLKELLWPTYQELWRSILPGKLAETWAFLSLVPVGFLLVLPAVLGVILVSSFFRPAWRANLFSRLLTPFWVMGFALWISELQRKDIIHLIYGSPILLVLAFFLCANFWRSHRLFKTLSMSLIVCSLLVLSGINLMVAVSAQKPMETRRGKVYLFKTDEAMDFLLKHTHPQEEVFIYPYYSMYYFLADLHNPTRFTVLVYGFNTKDQFTETVDSLEKRKVKYILWDTLINNETFSKWFPNYNGISENDLLLDHYLKGNYTIFCVKSGFRILQRN